MARSFDSFFRAHYDATRRQLVAKGAPAEVAADCAQEAFVRAYARWPVVRHYREPAAWVNRVANNLLVDGYRRDRRDTAATTDCAWRDEATAAARLDEAIAAIDLQQAVAELPPQQRRATELHYFEARSTDEGAAELGISGGAFRFHLSRARASLRARLESGDGEQ